MVGVVVGLVYSAGRCGRGLGVNGIAKERTRGIIIKLVIVSSFKAVELWVCNGMGRLAVSEVLDTDTAGKTRSGPCALYTSCL